MITATIREARLKLNELIHQALDGEEVVLLHGSRPVVTLTPVTSADLELKPRLSDAQAEHFWAEISRQRAAGKVTSFASAEEAVAALAPPRRGRRKR